MKVTGWVVTPGGVVDGHVEVAGDRIVDVVGRAADGAGERIVGIAATAGVPGGRLVDRAATAGVRAGPPWILPGFVDIHVHGGGGHTFTTGDPDAARGAAAFHLAHGTTTLLASLVSAPFELMLAATEALAPLAVEGIIAGVHHEGPYLSATRCGAQNPTALRDPSRAELEPLLSAGRGTVRMMTVAPERPGATEAIRLLTDRGVVAAIGHTDASYEQALEAVAAGARVATHLFNGMRPPHHRDPGPVYALLGASPVVCELVADGFHLHDGTLAFATSVARADRVALVTDALSAAGMPDGEYSLGGMPVVVSGRAARLAGPDGSGGTIAGSTLTMDAALRRAVAVGVSIVDAAAMAATTPARVIGLAGTAGALVRGMRADLVVLDADLRVRQVMRAGAWVDRSAPSDAGRAGSVRRRVGQ